MRMQGLFVLGFVALTTVISTCDNKKSIEKVLSPQDMALKISGERLSEKYCATTCHLRPGPELLNRPSWSNVLYKMREEMNKASLEIDDIEWDTLQSYYERFSPDLLNVPPRTINSQATLFEKNDEVLDLPEGGAITTLLKYNDYDASIFVGDARRNLLWLKDNRLIENFQLKNVPVRLELDTLREVAFVLCIGSIAPSDKPTGQLLEVDLRTKQTRILIDSLKRPIHFLRSDLDGDGGNEFIISSFGSTTGPVNSGRLSVFKKSAGKYTEQLLKELPGGTEAIIDDYNHDGRPDIFALFAQGSESIIRFTNEGKLTFTEQKLLEFSPVHGVADFTLADMDADGLKEIIVANGDNGDYSPIFKPYHGVRVYKNTDNKVFSEGYFQQINGAMRVIVRDFDLDGDPDIIGLSIYPNLFYTPEETLVFLENKGGVFLPQYLEKSPTSKWMLLRVGDVDGDGDLDIITGANNMLSFPTPDSFKATFQAIKKPVSIFLNTIR